MLMLQGLVEQISRLDLDEELGALGWRVLMSVDYEECWQQTGWVWIQPTDKGWIENIALFSGEPNGHCGFIKLLSVEELKELILKEAKGLMRFKPKDKPRICLFSRRFPRQERHADGEKSAAE